MRQMKPQPLKSPQVELDPGFRRPEGRNYLATLADLHERLKPGWYLEIGTHRGMSLAQARGRSIAIDPEFKIALDLFKALPELHMFAATSDDFFATGYLSRNAIAIDLAFLDGMHLFEFLLRDFVNTERAASPGGCITIHDCVPANHLMAAREWDKARTRHWTGDVWKILPILRQHRPDLMLSVLDCAPTGLLAVTGLDPLNDVLHRNLAEIVAEWSPVSMADYGVERFVRDFPLVAESAYVSAL